MRVYTVRKPGEPGTQKLVARYGDRLVSVRYRYDPQKGKRYKTVELIIAEEDWQPPEARQPQPSQKQEYATTPIVPVRIHYSERDLQRQVKGSAADGTRAKSCGLRPRSMSSASGWPRGSYGDEKVESTTCSTSY